MFVNFLMATNVFDMPAALFSRYLEFFDIETATPMQTWDQGTRRIYENLSANFRDRIYLSRPVRKVYRRTDGVVVEDQEGVQEAFDDVIFACNANQTLMILDEPTFLERYILSSIRYESELHNHTVVHSDSSVLPDNEVKALTTRSNHIEQYGARPDNYEITYIMHNQQPWAHRSDKPCLVTYNPISPIDERKVVKRWWFQHIVHDVRHVVLLVNIFRCIQGKRRTWHCGAHTLVNSQETCFVSGLATARQMGADYPFDEPRGEAVVQLLREHHVRLAVQEGVALNAPEGACPASFPDGTVPHMMMALAPSIRTAVGRGLSITVLALGFLFLAAACESEPTPTPELSVDEVLSSAAEELAALSTAKFQMTRRDGIGSEVLRDDSEERGRRSQNARQLQDAGGAGESRPWIRGGRNDGGRRPGVHAVLRGRPMAPPAAGPGALQLRRDRRYFERDTAQHRERGDHRPGVRRRRPGCPYRRGYRL